MRIASYNLENAMDPYDNPWTYDEITSPKSQHALAAIGKTLKDIHADVVLVQEIEHEYFLRDINYKHLKHLGYRHVCALPSNDRRGITVGLLSRFPIDSVTSYRHRKLEVPGATRHWRFARDVLHAQIIVDGLRLHLLGTHFKSITSRDPEDPGCNQWRMAESLGALEIVSDILKQDPQALILLCGDLNSDPGATPENAPPCHAASTLVRSTADSSEPLLYDCFAHLSREQRITLPESGIYSPKIFDHMLASKQLYQRMDISSARVICDPALTKGSDHRPLTAEFSTKKHIES